MISRLLRVAFAAICTFSISAAAALAQDKGSDPTQVGNNVKDIVSPNAKAFWWVFLVIGLLGMAATRKASRAGGIGALLLISGIAIYNPGGVGNFMQGIATSVL